MKNRIKTVGMVAILPVAALTFSACCSSSSCDPKMDVQAASVTEVQLGVPGGATVDTYQQTATVTHISKENRKITMVTPEGKVVSYTAGPEVINFDQIEIGDQVKAVLVEQVVIFARKAGTPTDDGAASVFVKAPAGEKPAIMASTSVEIVGKVKSVDVAKQTATLKFSDGSTKTLKVRKDVDLTKYGAGDEVVFRTTESMAVSVEKP